MRVKAYTDTARDNYGHLPTLAEWLATTDFPADMRMVESEWRIRQAAAALQALPKGDNPYFDCTIRVGYHPPTDGPFFVRKVDKGYIYVAYPDGDAE